MSGVGGRARGELDATRGDFRAIVVGAGGARGVPPRAPDIGGASRRDAGLSMKGRRLDGGMRFATCATPLGAAGSGFFASAAGCELAMLCDPDRASESAECSASLRFNLASFSGAGGTPGA